MMLRNVSSPPPTTALSLSLPPASSSVAVAKTAERNLALEQTIPVREVDLSLCCYGQRTLFRE